MKIMFACGGTAGHVNPALAVAQIIKSQHPQAEILFVGNPKGMEAKLVKTAKYNFAPIEVLGFQRKLNWSNLKNNTNAVRYLMTASAKAKKIIENFAPDLVMGTGGYVSGPVVRVAARMGIQTITHEQNAFPGVTTKLLARDVDLILLAVEEAKRHLPKGKNYIVTGNPIRQDILFADRNKAREVLGVGGRICLLSFGGSLGARAINEAVAEVVGNFYPQHSLHHIHATGKYGVELFPELLAKQGIDYKNDPHVDVREYIDNMPDCLAAADIVICRSGALSLSELQAVGKASILIPSPNVSENHQYHNAMVLADKNAAIVIEEKDLTPKHLCDIMEYLIEDPQERANIGKNAASLAIVDAGQRIAQEIYRLILKGNN